MIVPSLFVSLAYFGVPVLTLAVSALLIYWIYTRRWNHRGAKWFVLLQGLGMCWFGAVFVHLVLTDPDLQSAAQHLQLLFSIWTICAFVVFVSVYTRRGFHRSVAGRLGLGVGVVGSLALVATSSYHDLVFSEVLPRTEPFHYVATSPGVGFVVVLVVVVAMIGYSAYVLVQHLLSTRRRTEFQLLAMLGGILSIAGMELVGSLGVLPADGLSHAAYGALPFNVMMAVGLFRLRLFDVEPVARNTVVERLRDPILVLDRDGRLVDHNDACSSVWPSIADRVGDSLERVDDALAATVGDPSSVDGEASPGRIVVPVDGERRHYSVTVTPVERRHSEEVGWYAILLRDVTTLENSRRQLERQNEHLAQVGATISHDLRNPIQVATGYTDFLELTVDELAPTDAAAEPARDHLSRIAGSLHRMDEIIENVMTLAREGRTVESTTELPLSTVAREAWRTVETGDATLEVAADGTVDADRSRLLTIFENLFRNAVEHGGRSVTVTVAATEEGFAVADDGPGIPARETDTVFEDGYSTASDGTGLGLAIVRTMAASHGWTVSIDDEYDSDARFVFHCGSSADGTAAGGVDGGRPMARDSTPDWTEPAGSASE